MIQIMDPFQKVDGIKTWWEYNSNYGQTRFGTWSIDETFANGNFGVQYVYLSPTGPMANNKIIRLDPSEYESHTYPPEYKGRRPIRKDLEVR